MSVNPAIKTVWDDTIKGAGKFSVENGVHVIRLASTAPHTTQFHETLHSFYQTFAENEHMSQLNRVLHNAADSPYVMGELTKMAKADPNAEAVLAQLKDPEERVAFMHEMYTAGLLPNLNAKATTALGKIMQLIRKTFGIISNDERAANIMDAIHQGKFADADSPGVVARYLMEHGAGPKWLQVTGKVLEPVLTAAKEFTYSIGGKLQDSVPALRDLGAAFNPEVGDEEGRGTGYLQAVTRTADQWLNNYAKAVDKLDDYDKPEVLKALQSKNIKGLRGTSLQAAEGIRAALRKVIERNKAMGTGLTDRGEDYFPRVWDSEAIAHDVTGFASLLRQHGVASDAATEIANNLALHGGIAEPNQVPFWSGEHARTLPDSEAFNTAANEYMAKDLDKIMVSYMMHAAKRTEYVPRFGANGEKIDAMLAQAKRQGATEQELQMAKDSTRKLLGTMNYGDVSTINSLSQWAMTAANLAFMPLAIFGSMADPIGLATRTGDLKLAWDGYKNALKDVPKSLKEKPENSANQQMAEDFGVNVHQSLHMMQHAMYDSHGMSGLPRKINDSLFKYNLMDGLTRSVRTTAMVHAFSFIENHVNNPGKHSERWLSEMGLTPAKVKALEFENGKLKRDADNPVLSAAVHRYVDSVMGRPNKAQMPGWTDDPRFKILAQYKSYSYNFQRTILDRLGSEVIEHKNYRVLGAAAAYLPVVLGAMYAKSFITGGFHLGPQLAAAGPFDAVNMAFAKQFGGIPGTWTGALHDPAYALGPVVDTVAKSLGYHVAPTGAGADGLMGVLDDMLPMLSKVR